MRNVQLSYDFAPRRQDGWVRNALVDLLHAVQEEGSISGAARVLDLSYRHVWGELRRWEAQLVAPAVPNFGPPMVHHRTTPRPRWATTEREIRTFARVEA